MKRPPFKIRLFLKETRKKGDGTAPIYARVRVNLEKMELAASQTVLPEQWDDNAQLVINHESATTINEHLQAFKAQINEAHSQLYIARQEITVHAIKALILGDSIVKQHTLLQVTEEHNKYFSSLVGVKYSEGSYKNYRTTLKYLRQFIPHINGKEDIPLSQVNYKFCESFFTFLTTVKSCHTNGANKQIQRLKKLINYAIKHEYIQASPMATYTLNFNPVNKVALTLEELKTVMELTLSNETLAKVRDAFIVQCFTGLSYSDIKRLSLKHIYSGPYDTFIRMERQKTKVSFTVVILDPALLILGRYMNEVTDAEQPILPILSNQKMNQNLKLVQALAGITKPLTTHLGRHTFASTVTLNNGVPLESVSKMLGHTKLSTTQAYAKVSETKIANDMEKIKGKLPGVLSDVAIRRIPLAELPILQQRDKQS